MIDPRLQQAMDLHTAGQFDEAWERYKLLEQENPADADIVHLMGVLAGQVGNLVESVARIERAIKLQPKTPDFYKNLSITQRRLGNQSRAAETLITMGNIFSDRGQLEEALSAFAQAAEIDPRNEHGFNNLGVTLNRLGRYAEARDALAQALLPDPRMPRELAHWHGASLPDGFVRQLPSIHLNLGNALHGLGLLDEAIPTIRRALALNPEFIEAHNDFAIALLAAGQYQEGWEEFEWRWKDIKYARAFLKRPVWQGESAAKLGGRLFVLSEQGHGDAIMLCRYLKLLAAQGYDIVFEVKRELWALFSEGLASERITLVPAGNDAGAYDDLEFAAYTGTYSIPRLLGTTLQTIPADVPYLAVSKERNQRWAQRLASSDERLKVGLVWGGNPLHFKNFERSMPPGHLHKLLERDDVMFYSLQKGPAASYAFPRSNVIALDEELPDFAETAAAIAQLDVVIGVDTAVMHLAAALGKPAWLMLAHVPDWRWQMTGDASPWYPTARLFRQQRYGDWDSVVAQVGRALDTMVKQGL